MSKKPTYEELEQKVKDSEESLRRSEESARAALNATTDMVYLTDHNGNILTINDLAARRLGKTPDEVIDTNISDSFPSGVAQSIREKSGMVLGSGKPVCYQNEGEGEGVFHISIYPTFDGQGNVERLAVFLSDIKRREQAEEQLRASEYRFRTLFQNAPIGIGLARRDGRIMAGNDAIRRMFGYHEDELGEVNTKDLYLNPEEHSLIFEQFQRKGSVIDYVVRFKRKDGALFDGKLTVIPFTHDGEVIHLTVIQDVTEHKRTEKRLRESESRFRTLMETAPDGIGVTDLEGNISYVSSQMMELFGHRSKDEMVGKHITEIIAEEDRAMVPQTILEVLEKGVIRQIEYLFLKRDGTHFLGELSLSVAKDDRDEPMSFIGVLRDITERKRMVDSLRDSEERFRMITNASSDMIHLNDREGRIQFANPATETLLGYRIEDILNRPAQELLHPDDRERIALDIESVLMGKEVPAREIRLLRLDGTYMDAEVKGFGLQLGEDNKLVGAALRDITERRRLEEEVSRVQRLESLGILAGGIAHDFNNFLSAILINISMVKMYGNLEDDMFKMLTDAETASVRSRMLTQQLLTFASGGAPIRKPASVSALVEDTAAFSLSGSNVECEISMPDDLWLIAADEGQICQVIQNLTINADQAMPEGGTVKISARNMTLAEKGHVKLKAGRYVRISVEDEGCGISEKQISKVFDPFFSTKDKGRGLGLATSFSVVNRHDGHLEVCSEVGVGTTFDVYLPAAEKSSRTTEKERVRKFRGQGKILLVDDEDIVRKSTGEGLKRIGYEIECAKDGTEGIRLYEQAMKQGVPFHAVIMDLTIPGGMGGKEAIGKFKEIDGDAKVIVSSGYSDDPVMSRFEEYGFVSVIAKPFKLEELGKVLHNVTKRVSE